MYKKVLSFIVLISAASLSAKDVPIVESLALSVSSDKSVIEFPFKISSMSADTFIPEKGFSGGAPEIKKGENVLEISSQTPGKINTIVWGYDHPIFLEIVLEKSGEKYYKFTDPIGKDTDIKNLESNSHEDVVADLMVAAYNEKLPKGYASKTRKNTGKSGDVYWENIMEYTGGSYAVQTWKVTNGGKSEIELYEEMFASELNKIYGISIESPRLKSGEATRVFIVKKAHSFK
jgi:hypothetical protein